MRNWLIKKRELVGLTQEKVAEKANIERSYYNMIERGKRSPSVKVAQNIAEILSFEWTLFFTSESNESTQSKEVVQ